MMGKSNFWFLFLAGLLVWTAVAMAAQVMGDKEPATQAAEQPGWEIPVAAGVWYPQDGPLPDKPMRYYRVRCWPGCHSGSSLGMYPDKPLLGDTPLYSTSTVGNLPAGHPTLKNSHDPAN
jgi:hypothetical protein